MFDVASLKMSWQLVNISAEDFLISMSELGKIQEIQLVGSFADPNDSTVRTAHRDIDLPMHRDGIFTQSIADMQGGVYVEKPNVDIVGMYCIRDNDAPCYTMLALDEAGKHLIARVNLKAGQALIWDNRLWHGRQGPVGKRLLIRFWTSLNSPLV